MPRLIEQVVEIGHDAYGRRVTMKRRLNYDGKILWSIRSSPVNVRDEGEKMDGLTDDNVREMVRALDVIKR
jgi:hypothetical protein